MQKKTILAAAGGAVAVASLVVGGILSTPSKNELGGAHPSPSPVAHQPHFPALEAKSGQVAKSRQVAR